MKKKITHIENQDKEELHSELLELRDKNPFCVPDDYFSNLEANILEKTIHSTYKISSKSNKINWFKISTIATAAASVIFIAYLFFFDSKVEHKSLSKIFNNSNIFNSNSNDSIIQNKEPKTVEYAGSKENTQEFQNSDDYKSQIEENHSIDNQSIDNNTKPNSPIIIAENSSDSKNNLNSNQSSNSNTSSSVNSVIIVANGTPATSFVRISGQSIPTGFLGNDTCVASNCRLYSNQKDSRLKYQWSNGTTQANTIADKSGKYWVKIYNQNDELIGIDTINVKIVKIQKPNLGPDEMLCSFESIILDSKITDENYEIKWNISDKKTSKITLNNLNPGVYKVKVEIQVCGIKEIDEKHIKVRDCKLQIPNIITPNGDGFNDNLVISGLDETTGNCLYIMDRSGKIVYQNLNYQNDWNAEGLPDATYFYVFRKNDEKKSEYSGVITVKRY